MWGRLRNCARFLRNVPYRSRATQLYLIVGKKPVVCIWMKFGGRRGWSWRRIPPSASKSILICIPQCLRAGVMGTFEEHAAFTYLFRGGARPPAVAMACAAPAQRHIPEHRKKTSRKGSASRVRLSRC